MISRAYINKEPVIGPWGGGNKFVCKLIDKLKDKNIDVVHDLIPDIDVIFCFDPRMNKKNKTYTDFFDYKMSSSNKTKIIQRVGDVGTHSKPDLTKLVIESSKLSDFLIFPSKWAKEYIKFSKTNYEVIYNAPDKVFFSNRKNKKNIKG